MLRRASATGAAAAPGRLRVDPDATWTDTYGELREGSKFSYTAEVQLSPLVGVVGETGDVLAIRARGEGASPRRKLASLIDDCVAAIPKEARPRCELWIRIDSAGFSKDAVDACVCHEATVTITAEQHSAVRGAIAALEMGSSTTGASAKDADGWRALRLRGRRDHLSLRLPRPTPCRPPPAIGPGEQLSFDDLDGWRLFACVTNAPDEHSAIANDYHHRLRKGASEEAIRQLKSDFNMSHAPVQDFFGNRVWWPSGALAYNVARWLRVLAPPEPFATCRAKRLRTSFLNVPAK